MLPADAPERRKPQRKANKTAPALPVPEPDSAVFHAQLPAPPGMDPHGPAGYSPAPSLGGLLQALRRRWLLAFGLGIPVGIFAALAAWYLFPPKYTAQTLLHLSSKPPENAFVAPENRGELGVFQKNVLAMLKTRAVLEGALQNMREEDAPQLAAESKPVVWIERNLQGDFLLGQEILRLTLKGEYPDELATILNAVTKSYFVQAKKLDQVKRAEYLQQLAETYGAQAALLQPKQQQLKELEREVAVEDPATAATNYSAAYGVLTLAEEKLQKSKLDQKRIELEILAIRAQDKVPASIVVTEATIDEAVSRDLVVQKQQERLATVEHEIEETLKVAAKKENEPTLQPFLRERKNIQDAIARRRDDHRARLEEQLRKKSRTDNAAQLAKLQGELAIAQEQGNAFTEEVGRRKAEVERCKTKTPVQLDSLRNDVAQAGGEWKKLGAKIEALKAEPAGVARVTLIESAEPPQFSNKDRQMRLVGAAGFGAFCLVIGAVTLLELRSRKITTVDEVVHGIGMNVVGALPVVSDRERRMLPGPAVKPTGKDAVWPSLLTESIDAMRTLLMHAARVEPLRVVMVTSAMSGEGKTSLACHLASSLARAGQKTLLVDGDLRLPTAHLMLGLSVGPGLNEVLREEINPEEVVRPTSVPNLWGLTAGLGDARSLQALSSPLLRSLFLELREQFDFVIVDSSPVLAVADALLIGQHVDAVLFSILRAVSRLPTVNAAYQRLSALGIRLLGAVVIGANEEVYQAGYPYAVPG